MAREILCPKVGRDTSRTTAVPSPAQFPPGSLGQSLTSGLDHKSQPQSNVEDAIEAHLTLVLASRNCANLIMPPRRACESCE